MSLVINGRFLTQRMTGVQRYALEVSCELRRLRAAGTARLYLPRQAVVLQPPLPSLRLGRLRGHPWEQLELGGRVNHDRALLWSPCNVGPIVAKNHVVTIHDVFSLQRPAWVSRKFHLWYSWLLPRLAKAAQHVITVSHYAKGTLLEALPLADDKVSVVPLGVDGRFKRSSEAELSAFRKKYRLPNEFVLTLGSLEPRKNLVRVVEAWSSLPPAYRLPLVVAGGKGSEAVFGSYDERALLADEKIAMLGYVAEEDLPALYSAATVFVYASLEEGFGLPPLEALACSAPVVTSAGSATEEVCKGLATLVDPYSTASIAEGIVHVLDHSGPLPLRLTRAETTRARYSWNATASSIQAILQRYETP